ncbi:MAG: DNA repair protein RecN (Recombination protein N) [Candidatus Azotimanducaceae bacterium]|jgi:DNA repair protein RecN (Recombination protein N)
MLSHLTINNFALVDQLELDLSAGMTVVSGETGAGKSIMLDALALTLGNRADAHSVGLHGDKTEIFASFDISQNSDAKAWLEEHDLNTEDAECILRRVITKEGRSRAFINGAPCTLGDLKTLGDTLADIHSQHEHQSLLKRDTHRKLLDEFAGVLDLSAKVKSLQTTYETTRVRLEEIVSSTEEQTARAQLLAYQLEEIEQLSLKAGEDQALEAEQKRLSNGENILSACQSVIQLCESENHSAAVEQVSLGIQHLSGLEQPELAPILEMLTSAKIQLEEAVADLHRFSAGFEINPARLQEVEERLTAIYDLSRKHRLKPEQISSLVVTIQAELATLQNIDSEAAELEVKLVSLKQDYLKIAGQLSTKRKKAAKTIEKAVSGQLANLGMAGAVFAVALTPVATASTTDKLGPNGLEDIEFLISTNPGQTPRALNKIASGGELSRISLAIQVITADTSRVPSLVFDEVDVGIGGGVAEVVGTLLRNLGQKAQIICVTHLPQVAAQGHQHLIVEKSSNGKQATSLVKQLDDVARVKEIARMLGGLDMTEHSIAHAEEMYQSAQG